MLAFRQKPDMYIKPKTNGFTFVELVFAIFIFSVVITVSITLFAPSLKTSDNTEEFIKINLLVKEKCEMLRSVGFWIWDVDTSNPTFPGNPYDPAVKWAEDLAKAGYTKRGLIDVTFLKENSNDLVSFAFPDFDMYTARNKVQIDVTLYTRDNQPLTQTIVLFLYPSLKNTRALMNIMRTALEQYAYNNSGIYPATNELQSLISSYLAEIPNDPHTTEKIKITHTEESTDWEYINDAVSTITLSPNSHRTSPNYTLSWTY
jgi:type II secretory pathway pseudopilin PulG